MTLPEPRGNMSTRRLVALLCVAAAAVAVGATASSPSPASAAMPVGVSTQDFGQFTASPFTEIGFRKVRYIAPWNVALKRKDRDYLTSYLAAAQQRGIQVFVTFNVLTGSKCPRRRSALTRKTPRDSKPCSESLYFRMEAPTMERRPEAVVVAKGCAGRRLGQSRHGDGAIRFDRPDALR